MARSSFLFLALFVSPAFAAEPVAIQRDIQYAVHDGEKMLLDIARPTTPGPHPAVVCLHGGAWKFGKKDHLSKTSRYLDVEFGTGKKSLVEWLAGEGYVAVSVGYRLMPKHKFPAPVEDAKTAIRFLRANAARFDLDPDRIGTIGYSAGGHIAALVGTTTTEAGFEGTLYREQSSRVNCVVDFFGPTDLTLYTEAEGVEAAIFKPLLGARYRENPEIYRKASPIEHVTKDAPPFLILHGTADILVPIIHSERFHKKLVDAGAKSELTTLPGEGHGWTGAVAVKTMGLVTKFLETNLKGKR
ncbi:MAG: alpha/beta hydrolase [Gemmataceae bacterium]|nr:alpha/beta hydrolase [Planctomycetia bacterium]MBX3401292.1 alpha/beta hydrolase [Gemmataceae bacterium]